MPTITLKVDNVLIQLTGDTVKKSVKKGQTVTIDAATWTALSTAQKAQWDVVDGSDVGIGSGTGGTATTASLPPVKNLNAVAVTGAGSAIDLGVVHRTISMQTVVTGAPTVSITLKGSLDGTNYVTLATSTSGTGDLQVSVDKPVRFVKVSLDTLTGGTAPTVTAWVGASA